ncbi:MAG: YqgE/AlgH family protein [Rhodobiaceae bacterium]|jgi:putative transcriptional regulator|nr:YqgE/AlgH family protein [Rhodobiaceae bacterium]MBT7280398.1 YqgE/AlgH family protein [Rhodobiaceae bacterium]
MKQTTLKDHLLFAMPSIGDPRFDRSVIYMLAHDDEGAMGFILNRPAEGLTLEDIGAKLPASVGQSGLKNLPVFIGGPVQGEQGFIIHSADYPPQTPIVQEETLVGVTQSLEILIDAAQARGPQHMRLLLGYTGWGPGQLEGELQENAWLTCPANLQDIFTSKPKELYAACVQRLGFDLALLSNEGGEA